MGTARSVMPFTAIVGQDEMKLALILNVVNPKIGGVLIRGEKGTGKSTAVRALAELLPEIEVVKGCPFNCDPKDYHGMCDVCREKLRRGELEVERRKMRVVELPLGVTEDRVVGSLDIERAIKEGVKALEPGILAEANRQILYVDEINLLSDHIVDDLLDAAAFGVNVVEREGISVSHPSRFILVGSMNPEEGELRPQILDRIGLHVDVKPLSSVEDRLEVLLRVEEFDRDPEGFREKWRSKEEELRQRILRARELLGEVTLPQELMGMIARLCVDFDVGTHRADIVTMRCAKAIAALDGRKVVCMDDVVKAAKLALSHRVLKLEFNEEGRSLHEKIDEWFKSVREEEKFFRERRGVKHGGMEAVHGAFKAPVEFIYSYTSLMDRLLKEEIRGGSSTLVPSQPASSIPIGEGSFSPIGEWENEVLTVKKHAEIESKKLGKDLVSEVVEAARPQRKSWRLGKRRKAFGESERGKYVSYKIPKGRPKSIALGATLRAAAVRRESGGLAVRVRIEDVREKLFEYKTPLTILFVLDASGSMYRNINVMKEVIYSLHSKAYQYRDRAGLIVFKGRKAELLHPPTVNLKAVSEKLEQVQAGSWTPLAAALMKSLRVLKKEKARNPGVEPVIMMMTDGGANVSLRSSTRKSEGTETLTEIIDEIKEISEKIAKEKIKVVIIRPWSNNPTDSWRKDIALTIANQTKGKIYELRRFEPSIIARIAEYEAGRSL
ncbi:MAG: VWA domain-containing protein [Candidatus Freyarchaeota archaeon]